MPPFKAGRRGSGSLKAHLAREIPRRKARRIREGLVEGGHDAGEVLVELMRNDDRRIGQAERCSGLARGGRLVHVAAGKSRGIRAVARHALLRQAACHHSRIDSAGKQHPKRPIGDGAHAHRFVERLEPGSLPRRRLPVAAFGELARTEVEFEIVSVLQALDVAEDGTGRRHVAVREVGVDRLGRQAAALRRQERKHRAHEGAERQVLAHARVDERLLAHAVARQVGFCVARVQDREREHAAQALEQPIDPPGLVASQDELGVRARVKARPRRAQIVGGRLPVVDLAVVDDPDVAAVVDHRLVGLGPRVDDRKARVQQAVVQIAHGMLGIRAARPQRLAHRGGDALRHRTLREEAAYAAHGARGRTRARSAGTTSPARGAPTGARHGACARNGARAPRRAARRGGRGRASPG